MCGFTDDDEEVPAAKRLTAQQKVNFLELMLGQIANYCPIISRNSLVKSSTSIEFIWQTIRQHFGFQVTGAHFIDFADIHLEVDERPEDLYQRLMAFLEDVLIRSNSISHHGEVLTDDEELTPTLENLVILTWLKLIHPELPKVVKQRYGTELRSRIPLPLSSQRYPRPLTPSLTRFAPLTTLRFFSLRLVTVVPTPVNPNAETPPEPLPETLVQPKSAPFVNKQGVQKQHTF